MAKLHQFGGKVSQMEALVPIPIIALLEIVLTHSWVVHFLLFLDFFHFFLEKKIHDIFSLSARAPTLLPLSLSLWGWTYGGARGALIGRACGVGTTHWCDWSGARKPLSIQQSGCRKHNLAEFLSWDWNFQADKKMQKIEKWYHHDDTGQVLRKSASKIFNLFQARFIQILFYVTVEGSNKEMLKLPKSKSNKRFFVIF